MTAPPATAAPGVAATLAPGVALTALLSSWREGSGQAFAQVLEVVYPRLKQIAAGRLREMGGNSTFTPTELLHEAVLQLVETPKDFSNRAHFFAAMSLHIRSLLVDHVRARTALKRGGGQVQVSLLHADGAEDSMVADLLSLDQALHQLEALDPRSAAVLHLTYFAGLERLQIADVLQVSLSTVDRELRFARAWLSREFASLG